MYSTEVEDEPNFNPFINLGNLKQLLYIILQYNEATKFNLMLLYIQSNTLRLINFSKY